MRQFLTPEEFWNATGREVGIVTIRRLIKAGRIRHVRVGKLYLVLAEEVNRLAEILKDGDLYLPRYPRRNPGLKGEETP